jgi:hypothetical protein
VQAVFGELFSGANGHGTFCKIKVSFDTFYRKRIYFQIH